MVTVYFKETQSDGLQKIKVYKNSTAKAVGGALVIYVCKPSKMVSNYWENHKQIFFPLSDIESAEQDDVWDKFTL